MKWVLQTDKSDLIEKASEGLKKVKEITPPAWADYVKTGTQKERPPSERDWWYKRSASVLVTVMNRGPVGVSKLRTKYGGKKRRGHKPAEFRKGSGNILRKILQQLETAGLIRQQDKGVHKGRVLAPAGHSFLNTVAKAMKPAVKKAVKKKPEKSDDKVQPKPKAAPDKQTKPDDKQEKNGKSSKTK